jgi:hypothetical protein
MVIVPNAVPIVPNENSLVVVRCVIASLHHADWRWVLQDSVNTLPFRQLVPTVCLSPLVLWREITDMGGQVKWMDWLIDCLRVVGWLVACVQVVSSTTAGERSGVGGCYHALQKLLVVWLPPCNIHYVQCSV